MTTATMSKPRAKARKGRTAAQRRVTAAQKACAGSGTRSAFKACVRRKLK